MRDGRREWSGGERSRRGAIRVEESGVEKRRGVEESRESRGEQRRVK